MYKGSRIASLRPSLFKVLRFSTTGSALIFCLLGCPLGLVLADPLKTIDPTQNVDWAQGAINHAQQMRVFKDADKGLQPSAVIPEFSVDPDPSGQIATFQPEGSTAQGNNAFFQDLGTIHAQADPKNPPTADQQGQIVAFETGIFTAQQFDNVAGDLTAGNATGGPIALSKEIANFFVGVNDPVGQNPTGLPFDPNIFNLYLLPSEHLRSINRGEQIFNGTQINITGVTGLNDVLNQATIPGFCGTCHDTPNVGNHSVKAPLNIGIANAGANKPPALDISGLPVFTLKCTSGSAAGQV